MDRGSQYRFPLYAIPKDLIDLGRFDAKWKGERIAGRMDDGRYVPYYSRAEIEQGALRGQRKLSGLTMQLIPSSSIFGSGRGPCRTAYMCALVTPVEMGEGIRR